jgi:hypothetical protein
LERSHRLGYRFYGKLGAGRQVTSPSTRTFVSSFEGRRWSTAASPQGAMPFICVPNAGDLMSSPRLAGGGSEGGLTAWLASAAR